jgi:hypothetical protein
MAVRAHELALLDLLSSFERLSCAYEIADLRQLVASGQVIPRHRYGVKEPTAVGARILAFDPVVPLVETATPFPYLLASPNPVSEVILAVVFLPARLAPRLIAVASIPTVELGKRLLQSAVPACLLHCQIRLQIVADGANGTDMSRRDKMAR